MVPCLLSPAAKSQEDPRYPPGEDTIKNNIDAIHYRALIYTQYARLSILFNSK